MAWFEAYPARELPTLVSVAVSDLIPGDTSGLRVPLYASANESPEPNNLRAGDYLSAYVGTRFVFPIASAPGMLMSPFSRQTSALTPISTPASTS